MFRKSDALSCCLKYSAMLRQHLDSPTIDPIKVLRTDGDGVYQLAQFQEHLKLNGTKHQFTSRARPEDNARSERYGRTITEMARTMLANTKFLA
jgi:transposase InsO family protein